MSRRLLTAGFALAVLWGVSSGFGRISAKPPDLPLVENNVLPSPPLIVEECDAIGPNRLPIADAPTTTPAMAIPTLFQLRPSVRRTVASCLLFGVHPLLALAPTEGAIDLDAEDYAPANDLNIPIQSNTFIRAVPSYDAAAPSVCPFVRQQQCPSDRHAVLFADPDFSRDVQQNLEALRQSRELLVKARELGLAGRVFESLDALSQAADLSTGSRFDAEIQATTAEVLSNASAAERELVQKLSRPVTLNCKDAPLRQVIDVLRGLLGVNIYIDKAALDAAEISLEHPVSIQLESVAFKSALRLVLKEAHLTYVVKEDVVQITTEQSVRGGIQPALPPVDARAPLALDQVFYETLKVALSAAGESEEQEASVDSPFSIPVEFRFDLDGGFRMFAHFMPSGTVWHIEYNEHGLIWWASPDSGLSWERIDGGLE